MPPGFDAPAEARTLLRTLRAGALATVTADGAPFASLVSVATLVDGRPVLLLSRLAAHTDHLEADPRCALLLSRGGKGDPLAHPRLTVSGRARRLAADDPTLPMARSRFLRRQPKAALYADFPDFGFFVLEVTGAHLNGGFARAARLDAEALLASPAAVAGLQGGEEGAVTHMNADHRDALALYARVLCNAGEGDWSTTGLDPDGIDLACGDRVARLPFAPPVASAAALRQALVALAQAARAAAD